MEDGDETKNDKNLRINFDETFNLEEHMIKSIYLIKVFMDNNN